MTNIVDVFVPDIGGADQVDVIEILVVDGQTVAADDALITLESDKASMDIPAPFSGTVKEVKLAVGDKVSEGSLILTMETVAAKQASIDKTDKSATAAITPASLQLHEVVIPDIGDAKGVEVIEVNVAVGDEVALDQGLVTLESDKASMEVPATIAGVVKELKLTVGDTTTQGDIVAVIEAVGQGAPSASKPTTTKTAIAAETAPRPEASSPMKATSDTHAGPAVRQLARELGVELSQIKGTGRKGRILKDDLKLFVKQQLRTGSSHIATIAEIDFSQWGEITTEKLTRIKKISGPHLQRNWQAVPHVTQFDKADITELEAFRQSQKSIAQAQGYKLTPLAFIVKAVVGSLKAFPHFNASLAPSGESLIIKHYYHLGVAMDTPEGLVVPVLRDVDKKSVGEIAHEMGEISQRARDKKLKSHELQGASFTISSLGGIGGTGFTPIVNAPEVAILGVSKASMQPVYQHDQFVPRLILPLALSYDHRVIDGADGARFAQHLVKMLTDVRQLIL